MILASIKGFGEGPYEDCKVYENVAQVLAEPHLPPFSRWPAHRDWRDWRQRHRRPRWHRHGMFIGTNWTRAAAMRDGVLNLCRKSYATNSASSVVRLRSTASTARIFHLARDAPCR